ncbi:MAG TPA: DNA-directed DNA polymerase [archaeon]|nr:DNA-directed DNA polymerase [archaeon]
MKFCLLDADYSLDERPNIRLFGVDDKGNSAMVLDSFEPYFYALDKAGLKKSLQKIKDIKNIKDAKMTMGMKAKKFLQIFCERPSEVRDVVKLETDCFEYSINLYKRYLMDRRFYPIDWIDVRGSERKGIGFSMVVEAKSVKKIPVGKAPKLKIMALDIEAMAGKIVMFSVADNAGYREAASSENEKELLTKMQEIFRQRDPDVVATYNGDQFDFDTISQRADANGMKFVISRDGSPLYFRKSMWASSAKIKGRVHIDLYAFVSRLMYQQLQSEVFTLDEVSRELLGRGKETHTMEQLEDMWKNERKQMEKYCINDSELALGLCENLLPQIFALSRVSGQMPFDSSRMTFGALSEWYLVRKAAEKGVISPNPPHYAEAQARREKVPIKGGYVKEPLAGLHSNIAVFDFRSLYPSVIVSFNISPETLNEKGCKNYSEVPGFRHRFCKERTGFVPDMVKEILEKRARIRKKLKTLKSAELHDQQFGLKILANATYGMFANPNARWYSYECAESSAAYGRHYIQQAIAEAGKCGFVALYGDTDSLFVKLPGERNVKNEAKKFLKRMNAKLPGIMELDLQGFYRKGLFIPQKSGVAAKKRYALLDEKGAVTVRGLEAVRRDWCGLAKNLQREVIRLVLEGNQKDALKAVKDAVTRVATRQITMDEIAISTQLSRSLEQYKTKNVHSIIARKLKEAGKSAEEGTIFSYVIKKGAGSISDRAELSHTVGRDDYDADYYINNQILPAAFRILQTLGYRQEDLLAGGP